MSQKMAVSGNTYYIFDDNGDGMSFTSMGRVVSSVQFNSVSLMMKNLQDVHVLSILGNPSVNKSDVLFDGQAGVSNLNQRDLVLKAKRLQCLNVVPFRVMHTEEPGLMQVIFALKVGSVSKTQLSSLFEIKEWRNIK